MLPCGRGTMLLMFRGSAADVRWICKKEKGKDGIWGKGRTGK